MKTNFSAVAILPPTPSLPTFLCLLNSNTVPASHYFIHLTNACATSVGQTLRKELETQFLQWAKSSTAPALREFTVDLSLTLSHLESPQLSINSCFLLLCLVTNSLQFPQMFYLLFLHGPPRRSQHFLKVRIVHLSCFLRNVMHDSDVIPTPNSQKTYFSPWRFISVTDTTVHPEVLVSVLSLPLNISKSCWACLQKISRIHICSPQSPASTNTLSFPLRLHKSLLTLPLLYSCPQCHTPRGSRIVNVIISYRIKIKQNITTTAKTPPRSG